MKSSSKKSNATTRNGAALINRPVPFEHDGETYHVKRIDDEVKAEFEEWLIGEAQGSVARLRKQLSHEDWEAAWAATIDYTTSGAYLFGGPFCVKALNMTKGFLALAAIMFGVSQKEMRKIRDERTEEIDQLITRLYSESFPNSKAPAKEEETPQEPQQAPQQPPQQPSLADVVERATTAATKD